MMLYCTEDGCDRAAVLTVVEPQSGRGGHLCQLHAEQWCARFLAQSTTARADHAHDEDRGVLLQFGVKGTGE